VLGGAAGQTENASGVDVTKPTYWFRSSTGSVEPAALNIISPVRTRRRVERVFLAAHLLRARVITTVAKGKRGLQLRSPAPETYQSIERFDERSLKASVVAQLDKSDVSEG